MGFERREDKRGMLQVLQRNPGIMFKSFIVEGERKRFYAQSTRLLPVKGKFPCWLLEHQAGFCKAPRDK